MPAPLCHETVPIDIRDVGGISLAGVVENKVWLPGMDSNHEETGSLGISRLLIRRSATSQESRENGPIRTAFVQKAA
jgi:hypothetical protein